MKTSKKSVVGVVKILTQLNGENNKENKDLNAKIVVYFSPLKTNLLEIQTDLFGLKKWIIGRRTITQLSKESTKK